MLKYPKGSLLPTSTAKTAYELLGDICEAIKQEPARVDMNYYITRHGTAKTRSVPSERGDWATVPIPACKTTGCIAGWAILLRQPRAWADGCCRKFLYLLSLSPKTGKGVPYNAVEALMYDTEIKDKNGNHVTPGTRAYANGVIRNIRTFQQKYRKELQEKQLPKIRRRTRGPSTKNRQRPAAAR